MDRLLLLLTWGVSSLFNPNEVEVLPRALSLVSPGSFDLCSGQVPDRVIAIPVSLFPQQHHRVGRAELGTARPDLAWDCDAQESVGHSC